MSRKNRVIKNSFLSVGRPNADPAVDHIDISAALYGVKISMKQADVADSTFENASEAIAKGMHSNGLEVSLRSSPGSQLYWTIVDEYNQPDDTEFVWRPRNAPKAADNPEYKGGLCINSMPDVGGQQGAHAWEGAQTWTINGPVTIDDGATVRVIGAS